MLLAKNCVTTSCSLDDRSYCNFCGGANTIATYLYVVST